MQPGLDLKNDLRQAVGLAVLGYAYIFGVIIALIAVSAFSIYFLCTNSHAVIFIKILFVPILLIVAIAKSLWVKSSPPEGVQIKQKDAPKLFELIAEIRTAAQSPPIHSVLLTSEFNCAVAQIPRLGLFGFYKNYLCLGLPLIGSMPTDHFKAVLAHEMGHLSARHSKLSGWIYHVMNCWLQLVHNLSKSGFLGTLLFKSFANWFYPLFQKRTIGVLRFQEYEADILSGSLVGNNVMAQALALTEIKSMYLDDKFWTDQLKRTRDLPEPPDNAISAALNITTDSITDDDAAYYLQLVDDQHDALSSHPKLSERVKALDLDSELIDLLQLFNQAKTQAIQQKSAAHILLGSSFQKTLYAIEEAWRKEVTPEWHKLHATYQERKKFLAQLDAAAASGKLSTEDLIERAELTSFLGDEYQAMEMFANLLTAAPDDARLHYHLGHILLKQAKEEGVQHLEQSAKLGKKFRYTCFLELYEHYTRKREQEKAQEYLQQSIESALELSQAALASSHLSTTERLEASTISPFKLERICVAFYAEPHVKQAWILKRLSPEIINTGEHLLVLELGSPHWYLRDESESVSAFKRLAELPEFSDFSIVLIGPDTTELRDICKKIPGSQVYDREQWAASNAELVAALNRQNLSSKTPFSLKTYLVQNKMSIIGLIALVALILFLGGAFRPKTSNSTMHRQPGNTASPRQTYVDNGRDFAPYMSRLQHDIKVHWRPPKLAQSCKTVLQFKIHRDGRVSDLQVARSSGNVIFDQAGLKAVSQAAPFAPLPVGAEDDVDIQFALDYNATAR